jgi:small conductance mechanosensitive channel
MDDLLTRLLHFQPALLASVAHDVLHLIVAAAILAVGWWLSNRIGVLFARAFAHTRAKSRVC